MSSTPFVVHRHRLRPGSRAAIKEWQQTMEVRSAEVVQTLRAEGIELELVLFEPAARDGDADGLIFILRTHDFARAVDVFMASTMPIDLLHQEFLAAVSEGSTALEVLSCHDAAPVGVI